MPGHSPGITVEDVDGLLAGFRWLRLPPRPLLPKRDPDIHKSAAAFALKEAAKEAEKKLPPHGLTSPSAFPFTAADCEREKRRIMVQLLPAKTEEQYRHRQPAYAKIEQESLEAIEKERRAVRERLDLLFVSVKFPLLQLSEMGNAPWEIPTTLETYQTAIQRSDEAVLDKVIQDLERIKAKLLVGRAGMPAEETPSSAEPELMPVAQDVTKEQPWADDAPEYLPLSEAHNLIDNRKSVPTLSKLCKPDGGIRYMRKKGVGCKVHIGDFLRYFKSCPNDPEYLKIVATFIANEGKGDMRFRWKCQNCGGAVAKTADRCPNRDCTGHEPASFKVNIERVPPPKPRW